MTEPGAAIPLATLPNLRDLGGWTTADGRRIRLGEVYRSTELGRVDADDLRRFAELRVRTIFDLRTAVEREASPDRVPDGVRDEALDVLADAGAGAAPAELMKIVSDPASADRLLGDGRAQALFAQAYRQIVSLPSALASYRRLYTELAEPANRPALFHCTTGKDRTGWGAAALLSFLGVPEELVIRDYLLTNEQLLPALEPVFQQFEAAGGDRALLVTVLGVERDYLETAFDELHTRFGDIQGYFDEGLALEASVQQALRDALLE
ncbi:tyrosine-protein phosphatase [Agromyces intestinalis]|uniref:Tyrosine-protein phosphatase n=1 Tax=Agromyces intestinalis TaxID=2592652 RepID=A0A5C1YEV8_9MICO|nr:tyrosine-protein phosphatase [Agromyces intestinalis]QEO14656.1 tyrosine-protein phosphatase [Agromyces intestinalis]